PNDAEGRARVSALAQLLASDVHPLNNLRVLQNLVQKLGVNEDTKMTWYRHWITEGFVAMEAMLSQAAATGQCCHGDTPTLADLCLVPQVYNAERFNCDLSDYPTVQRVAEHCRTLPAFQTAEPGKQPDSPQ
ncbi:MAG: maleylacetoacetate isomerase, partial [Natronospirillum sp.]